MLNVHVPAAFTDLQSKPEGIGYNTLPKAGNCFSSSSSFLRD